MIGFVLQARSTSSRLPGKVLMPFFQNRSILQIIIENLKESFSGIPQIVATTSNPQDDPIVDLCEKLNIPYYRGDEHNVVLRTVNAAKQEGWSSVIRVCSDNPFLNMELLEVLLNQAENTNYDYLSFKSKEGIPVIRTHLGLFVEFAKTKALEEVLKSTEDSFYLEHVTNYIYGNPEQFDVKLLDLPQVLQNRDDLRFTIDNPNDFETGQKLYRELPDHGQDLKQMVKFVDEKGLNVVMLKEINKYQK